MARHESDREDLFAELAALTPRLELQLRETGQIVCAGCRESTGGWSLFLGPEEVYHTDADSRLRRAYVRGHLYRSEGNTLSQLTRERTPEQTVLRRHDLSREDVELFLNSMAHSLRRLLERLNQKQVDVLRLVDQQGTAVAELERALTAILATGPELAPAVRRG